MVRRSKRESLLRWRVLLGILCLSRWASWSPRAAATTTATAGDAAAPAENVDIAAELKKPANADGLGLDAGHRGRRADVREGVSEHQRQVQQRRPGRAALPEAPHGPASRARAAGRRPDGVPVHPELHHHRRPAGPDALPAGRLPGAVSRVDLEADQPRRRRSTASRGTPARWASSTARTCSTRPASPSRPRRGRSSPTAARKYHEAEPGVLPGQHARQPDAAQWFGLFWQNGARPFAGTAENLTINLTDPKIEGGHRVLGRADQDGVDLHRRGLHRRLVPGPRQRQVRGLGLRRLGAGLPPGHGGQDLGQVARAPAAAVERGRRRVRQLGRLHARGAEEHEVPRARGRALALAPAGAGADEDVHARAVPVPAAQRRLLEDPEWLNAKYDFYGGQQVNKVYAEISETVADGLRVEPDPRVRRAPQGDDLMASRSSVGKASRRHCSRGRTRSSPTPSSRASRSPGNSQPRGARGCPRAPRDPSHEMTTQAPPPPHRRAARPGPQEEGPPRTGTGSRGSCSPLPFMVLFLFAVHRAAGLRAVPEPVPRAADRRHLLRGARQLRRGPQGQVVHERRGARRALPAHPGPGHAAPGARVRADPRLGQGVDRPSSTGSASSSPTRCPTVIAALMWGFLYGRDFGPFADIAEALGTTPPELPQRGADAVLDRQRRRRGRTPATT